MTLSHRNRKSLLATAALAALASAQMVFAAPLVNVQLEGSLSGNPGTFLPNLSNVPAGTTITFEIFGQSAPAGTTNPNTAFTPNGTQDKLTSLQYFTVATAGNGNFTASAIDNSFNGTGSSAGTTGSQSLAIRLTKSGGQNDDSAIQLLHGTFVAGSNNPAITAINDLGNSNLGAPFSNTTGSFTISSTHGIATTTTTESGGNPYVGFTGLNFTALTWDGAAGNGNWDINSTANFSGSNYSDASAVIFGDTAADGKTAVANTHITITSGGVLPSTVNFINNTATYQLSTAGAVGIGGATSVNINAGGTVRFSSPNTYSGGTTITSGTLKAASGSLLSTGSLTIGAAGKLFVGDGSSSVPATLSTGNQTWTGGGTFATKVDGTAGATGSADQLTIGGGTGTLTLSGAAQGTPFTVSLQTGDAPIGTPSNGTTWQIASFGSLSGYNGPAATAGGVNPGSQFTLDTSAFGSTGSGFSLDLIQVDGSHESLDLIYAATPEPATAVLGLSALTPMLLARRRRMRRDAPQV